MMTRTQVAGDALRQERTTRTQQIVWQSELLSLMPQVLHGPMAVLCLPILDLNDLIQAAGALTNRVAE